MEQQDAPAGPAGPQRSFTADQVGEFVIAMVQAFLRTGYYLSSHPESRKAKAGLFERFQVLTAESGEISFILREDQNQRVVSIEGVSDRPLRLQALVTRGMADTYNPRFVQFLERKELLSLSLSARMTAEEFSSFIDLMSEPSLSDMHDHALRDRFTAGLKAKGIAHLSFVFHEDFIASRPGVPWRATLALSRLKKDLRMIPIFRTLRPEELHEVRREVLVDILRPLHDADLLYAFLMNIDLASSQDLPEPEAEDHFLALVDAAQLIELTAIFIADATGVKSRFCGLLDAEKVERLRGKIQRRLAASPAPAARKRLEEMFEAGLVSLEELPAAVRQRVLMIRLARDFLQGGAGHLQRLEQSPDLGEYERHAEELAAILTYLLEEKRFAPVVSVVEALARHAREDAPRAAVARRIVDAVAGGVALEQARIVHTSSTAAAQSRSSAGFPSVGLLDVESTTPAQPSVGKAAIQAPLSRLATNRCELCGLAAVAFLEAAKEERVQLGRLFIALGSWSVPHLIAILARTEDVWRRKGAVEILVRIGAEATAALVHEIEHGTLPAPALATVIRVLAEVSDPALRSSAATAIAARIESSDAEVRREAVTALVRLDPHGSFELLERHAGDADTGVRKAALRGLGMTGDQRALDPLVNAVNRFHGQEPASSDDAIAGLEALAYLHETCPAARETIEGWLPELAADLSWSGWKSILHHGPQAPVPFLMTLAETLHRIATPASLVALGHLAKHREEQVARKASALLGKAGQGRA